jgi:hypothetical protein
MWMMRVRVRVRAPQFFNGGATLQFAAIPMNLLGKPGKYATQDISGGVYKTANYVRSGHWSEKARDEARMYCHVHEVCPDPTDLYFEVPDGDEWDIDPRGAYLHYTAADTRQGFEFQEFPYEVVPEGSVRARVWGGVGGVSGASCVLHLPHLSTSHSLPAPPPPPLLLPGTRCSWRGIDRAQHDAVL